MDAAVGAILAVIHRWNLPQFLYNWQTLIAGIFAVVAAWRTIRATVKSADREVKASQDQTAVAQRQIETTVQIERRRDTSEALTFHSMLKAAMTRVLAEAAWARENYKSTFESSATVSPEALAVRQCITKGAFAELRTACITQVSPLIVEFLDVEREIDSFALQWKDTVKNNTVSIREGKHAGLGEQLAAIEKKAAEIEARAAELSARAFKAFEKSWSGSD